MEPSSLQAVAIGVDHLASSLIFGANVYNDHRLFNLGKAVLVVWLYYCVKAI